MEGAQGAGNGAKENNFNSDGNLEQIEYLLYQSTQGVHFMFENAEIAKVLRAPVDESEFFTFTTMEKVQELLTELLDRPTMLEKRSYLDHLPTEDYELMIRAYFHLVENTILANSNLRH